METKSKATKDNADTDLANKKKRSSTKVEEAVNRDKENPQRPFPLTKQPWKELPSSMRVAAGSLRMKSTNRKTISTEPLPEVPDTMDTEDSLENKKKRIRHDDPTDFVHKIPAPEAKRRKKQHGGSRDKKDKEDMKEGEIDILVLNEMKAKGDTICARTQSSETESTASTESRERADSIEAARAQFDTLSRLSSRSLFMSLPVSAPFLVEHHPLATDTEDDKERPQEEDSDRKRKVDSPSKFFRTISIAKKKRITISHNNPWKKKQVDEPYSLPEEATLLAVIEWLLFTPDGKSQTIPFLATHRHCGISAVDILGILCDIYANGASTNFPNVDHVEALVQFLEVWLSKFGKRDFCDNKEEKRKRRRERRERKEKKAADKGEDKGEEKPKTPRTPRSPRNNEVAPIEKKSQKHREHPDLQEIMRLPQSRRETPSL
eukprot:TRINITY_DN2893_c0_g1_i1.p1 TRINITY_DN2893_c0_g1~~TRINITY_DN2893_c0_g1_i1.p1  ORF type:complete len:434 (-),score=112.43 TRINITY_DN2893_c0_g1_i1:958-2259(-)